jgi:hypothetical protein
MFSDPQSVTVNAVAQSLPATSREGRKSVYQKADGSYTLTMSHDVTTKKERHLARLDHRKTVSDPLTPANNVDVMSSVYVVFDHPITGFSDTELRNDAVGLLSYLTASSGANIDKLLGLES